MAIVNITVDKQKTLGNQFYQLVQSFRSNHSQLREFKEMMDNMTDGVTYTEIESRFGVSSTNGQAVYNLVAGSLAELDADTNFTQMVDRLNPLS